MRTSCAPIIADLFLYCYESQFKGKCFKEPSRYDLLREFNNTCIYRDDVLVVNNPTFENYVHDIFPKELFFDQH